MREVNWRHFADGSCASCAHPRHVQAGSLCSEHGQVAEAFVRGFEQAARLAVQVVERYALDMGLRSGRNWIVVTPGMSADEYVWGKKQVFYFCQERAEQAAREAPPWWPVQPGEVESPRPSGEGEGLGQEKPDGL